MIGVVEVDMVAEKTRHGHDKLTAEKDTGTSPLVLSHHRSVILCVHSL